MDHDYSEKEDMMRYLSKWKREKRMRLDLTTKLNDFRLRNRTRRRRKMVVSCSDRLLTMMKMRRSKRVSSSNSTSHVLLKRLNSKRKRSRMHRVPSNISSRWPRRVSEKHYYEYGDQESILGGYKYGASLWLREDKEGSVFHETEKALRFNITIHHTYRLRSGLSFTQKHVPSIQTIASTVLLSTNCSYVPLPLPGIIIASNIPDRYVEAMVRDISRSAHLIITNRSPHVNNITLCLHIQIIGLQRDFEDVINTMLRCQLEGLYRTHDVLTMIYAEEPLKPLRIREYTSSSIFIAERSGTYVLVPIIDENECSICLDELRAGCSSYVLPCSHVYHYNCITKWMSAHNFCPLCRHPYRRIFPPHVVYPISDDGYTTI